MAARLAAATTAATAALALLAHPAAADERPAKPLIAWMLETPAGAASPADPTARLRARTDHAARQLHAAARDEVPAGRGGEGHFARGAAALLLSTGTTHDPAAVVAAVRKAEDELVATAAADRLHRSFRADGRSLDAVGEDERAETVRRLVADRRFAQVDDAAAARFLALVQDDLRGERLSERRARAIFQKARAFAAAPPSEGAVAEGVAALDSVKAGVARQDAALAGGLSDSIARIGKGDLASVAAAAVAVDAAVLSARNITPDLLKTIDALERLGVIGETHAELTVGVARFDSALSIVQGGLAVSMANPAGVVQVLQGLADLIAPAKAKAADGRSLLLGRVGARLDEVALLVEESNLKLDRLQESLDRLRIDMALSFERQQRELERLRQALTGLVATVAFQDFESCVLVEDVLRKATRLQVVDRGGGAVTLRLGGDWAQRLRTLRAEPSGDRPPAILQECARSMLRLFGTDAAASVAKPFAAAPADDGAAERHALLVRTIVAEMAGGPDRAVSPQGLARYLGQAGWIERPSEAARLWRRTAQGDLPPAAAADAERLLRGERIDPDRLAMVAPIALYLAPIFWLAQDAPAPAATPAEHPGIRVLTNLAALLDRALLDAAIAEGFAALPAALAAHGRLAAEHARRFDAVAAQGRALAALPDGESEARRSARAELARRIEALDTTRAALLELEAAIGGTEALHRQAVDFALHAAVEDAAGAGPARTRLMHAWRIGLAGEAVARGSARWVDPSGRTRDVRAEMLRGTVFGWQLDRPDVRRHLHDRTACRSADGGEAAWIAAAPLRPFLVALCGRLATTDGPLLFAGRPIELPTLEVVDAPAASERLRSLRRLAGEARTILRLARAQVIDDGSDRPIVVAGR